SLPQVEYPVISVSAGLPGADPETVASAIVTPLERQFSRIAGVNEMTSVSGLGSGSITLQFDMSRDVNGAARDVQAAINAARSQLPSNLPQNPSYRKINPADSPILILALTSDTMSIPQIYDACDSIFSQKIAQISGVGQVFCGGSAKPAVRIEANPAQLANYGLGLEALRSAVGTVNVHQPTGYLQDEDHRWMVSTSDQLFGAAAYAPLVIATDRGPVSSSAAKSGLPTSLQSSIAQSQTAAAGSASAAAMSSASPAAVSHGIVRIQDVAEVNDSVENIYTAGSLNGKRAILVIVFKTSTANVIDTVDNVLNTLPQLQAEIPASIDVNVALDRTTTIRAAVKDITRTLIISVVLVVLVVFVFLREVRTTLIPSVSVPLSLLGTFGMMYLLGYTLDNLSLMALAISTGFVVDDAIVVVENITRHLESGMSPFKAAMVGSKEIGFTVLSMSTSLIAVFIPILLMAGIVGRLFREFAVTLSIAILMSLVVSLTTTPMLSARFVTPHGERSRGRFYRWGEKGLAWLTAEYERGLRWVLRHRWFTLTIPAAAFVLTIILYFIIPSGLFPQQDTGRIGGRIVGQQDISFAAMKDKVNEFASIVAKDPGVQNVMAFVGGGGPGGGSSNMGSMFISLKDDAQRHKTGDTADAIVNRLRPQTAGIPGATLYLQSFQELRVGGRSAAALYQYSLTAENLADLNEWAPKLLAAMQKLPEIKDANSDQQNQGLRAQLVIDRDTASRLGVTPLAIDSTLSDAFGQRQVSTTYMPLNQYHVVMEVAPEYQRSPDALKNIYVKSTSGAMVPLSQLTHYEQQRIPLAVNHQSQMPSVTLSFNLTPGVSLGEAAGAIEAARESIGMPSTVRGGFAGTAQVYQASMATMPWLVLLAVAAVYIVLGMLYESFIHPITILSTLPSAGVGAFVALLLFRMDLNVFAMIGFILLIGIVKKNAIMMIDFAISAQRQQGKTAEEAIYQACMLRFRPIMMTTMAALLGGVPLAFGTGTGSELRRPLGIAIVGGLIVSQCLTLFTTPAVYLFFEWLPGAIARFARYAAGRKKIPDVAQAVSEQ
ncbi:MAG: efflux RND transporter permease subunit, partial [Acidobacteriaceae bacterium]|nr:efflux RND transporter permease subunit [Acidobacteriaceae bacterium]